MHRQLFQAPGAHGVHAGVIPNIGAIASMLAQLEVVDVPSAAALPHEDQFVLAAIEAAHASVGLVPDTEVLELAVDLAASRTTRRSPVTKRSLFSRASASRCCSLAARALIAPQSRTDSAIDERSTEIRSRLILE